MRIPAAPSEMAVVLALGATQTLSWASSYYLPAILAVPMAADLGLPNAWVFAAFTGALLVAGAASPLVGREIDRKGGRVVLACSNVLFALGLCLLAAARDGVTLAAGWLLLGVAMAMGLYDAAFAALAGFYGRAARAPITGITLIAGFASTIGWPISAAVEAAYGWRCVCLAWAGVQLLVCLPLNWLLLPAPSLEPRPREAATARANKTRANRSIWLLALFFSLAWFVTGAMATQLPRLLEQMGTSTTAAIAAAALVGPAQVLSRLVEFGLFRNLHPLISARLAVILHPIGAASLAVFGAPAAAVFTILHGAGNGLLTIARGTLPLALFGSTGYGLRQGLLGAPARLTQATSPFLFGLILDYSPRAAILASSVLMLLALACLLALRAEPEPAEARGP